MGFFSTVDEALNNGGEDVLNGASKIIPGAGVVVDGVEGVYHGAHAVSDLLDGNTDGALHEGGEALWHGGKAVLNFLTDGESDEIADAAETGYNDLQHGSAAVMDLMNGDTNGALNEGKELLEDTGKDLLSDETHGASDVAMGGLKLFDHYVNGTPDQNTALKNPSQGPSNDPLPSYDMPPPDYIPPRPSPGSQGANFTEQGFNPYYMDPSLICY